MTPHPLQPGAELDAEVAKAMGWKPDTSNGKRVLVHDSLGVARDCPPYSIDMAAAWEVVAHMRNEGWLLELIDGGNEFAASFRRPPRFPGRYFSKFAPHAICIAALEALAAVASGRKERA